MTFEEILANEEKARAELANQGKTTEQLAAEQKDKEESDAEAARLAEEARLAAESNQGKSQEEIDAEAAEAERLAEEAKAKAEEPKSLLDALSLKKDEKKEVELPDEFKERLSKVEAEKAELASKLQSIESDPLVKAVMADATKQQLIAIAAELNGKDYSKSSYKDLIATEIQNISGFEGEELAEQVELALEEFNALPKWKQVAAEKEIQAKFQASSKKGESARLQALEDAYLEKTKGVKSAKDIEAENQLIIQSEINSIKTLGEGAIGTSLFGVPFTQEELNDIITKEYHPAKVEEYLDEKGNLDAAKFIVDKFKLRNLDKMLEAAREDERKKHNIKTSVAKGTNLKGNPVNVDELTDEQKNMKAMGFPTYMWQKKK